MNKGIYKLVFGRVRHMLVAVADFANAHGNTPGTRGASAVVRDAEPAPALRALALAAMLLVGNIIMSAPSLAQIVAAPGSGARVVQTQNGLPQVDIAKPSSAGVSLNKYSQFDVQKQGAILNNSATITATTQAGYVNGNANLTPGNEARVIVNQVLSNSPSQLRGFLEVAGRKAEVIVANPNGLVVDGGGFINTSRAVLTTGTPNFGPNGNLAGFTVNGGNVSIQGAGLNASNVDAVDILARAVEVNAAIYANQLNVVAGANQIDHDTLAATPIAGNGAAPSVAIDVSQLGGMYANRIFLASNENGVGVSTRGILAAQAGDLTLKSNGQLVLAGTTNASGSISVSARDGIDNSGATYAQRDVNVATAGGLSSSGILASQNNTTVNAGSVASTGTLGAGVNNDGTIANAGNLNVIASGAVSARGRNEGGGNTTIRGASVDLAGSNTSANGALALDATSGDMNLSGASTTAGGTLDASAAATLTNDGGKLSSGAAMRVAAASLSNANGQLVSQSTLDVNTRGALSNRSGTMQAAGRETVQAGSLDNTGGKIASLNGDGLSVSTTSALVNGASGTIGTNGTNGTLDVDALTLSNAGQLTAAGDAHVRADTLDNRAGSVTAGGALDVAANNALDNTGGTLSGAATNVSGASIDNTRGTIEGDTLAVSTPGALVNAGGTLTQYGAADQTIHAGGALDNTGGTIASNATNLGIDAQTIANNGGKVQHAGTGALALNSKGTLSNASGNVVTNGALDNHAGTIQAAKAATVKSASLDNTGGRLVSLNGDGLKVTTSGALVNGAGGVIGTNGALDVDALSLSNAGQLTAASEAHVRAATLDNRAGSVTAGGALDVAANNALDNTGGTISGGSTTVSGASIDNTRGTIEGDTLAVSTPGALVNASGTLTQYGAADQTIHAAGALDNAGGTIASNATNLGIDAQTITNDGGKVQHAGTGALAINAAGALSNVNGSVQTNGALTASGASVDNTGGTLLAMNAARIDAASGIVNRGGSIYGAAGLHVGTQGDIDNASGSMQTAGDLNVDAAGALANTGGTISANGPHGSASVSAARIDNTGGTLTNAGDGATTISASDVVNTGGTLGGNGDVTLNAQTLDNNAGANLVAGGAANLNVAQTVNNADGTLFGGTALNLNQASATVINDGGAILGGLDVSLAVASLSNAGGSIRANRDVSASGVVSGDGAMIAGRDLSLDVVGDYTNGTANNLHADGDMRVAATGTLSNAGTLDANGALTVIGHDVVNAAGADINSSTTSVNAVDMITNAGRIEGDTVTTNSAALANTGTVIGNDVTVNATDVTNSGAAAVIAGAERVRVYAANSVVNEDGALIYSLGNLEIGRDGTRDAEGLLANQTGLLVNSAATIAAEGDIDIAARTVQNIRTGVVTEAGAPQDAGTTTRGIWTAGLSDIQLGSYHSKLYPQWNFGAGAIGAQAVQGLAKPLTVTLPKDQVTNLDSSAQTFSLATPLEDTYRTWGNVSGNPFPQMVEANRVITTHATQWYNSLTDNGDGTVTVTFWPDYDPRVNIRPDQLKFDTSLGSDNHDYVEMKRTTQTTTATDQLISAGTAATIQAQGAIRINADGGLIENQSSTIASGGNLKERADNGGKVEDTGTVLQQTITETNFSDWYWHQKTGGDSDYKTNIENGVTQTTTTVNALPAITSSNQTVQIDATTISINSVDRQGNTVIGSGVTGGSADGTQTGAISGQGGKAQTIDGTQASSVSGQTSAPQTVGGATGGIPNLKLPTSGLYTYNTTPGATYLIATDPRLTNYAKFISSDYMLGALDLDPQKTIKRLGDGMYEQTLIRNQITQLTGRTFLAGFTDAMDEYTALMNNGVGYAKAFGLAPGIALTAEQMARLTTDMVWLVSQDVTLPDGSHETVLVPQLYLASANAVDLSKSGALVAGNAVNLFASGDVVNSGHVASNLATTIIGNNVSNSGVIGSAGTTAVVAVQDVRNTSGRIGGADVLVQAGRDVINETHTYGVASAFGSGDIGGRVTGTGVNALGTISATNNATVIAGRDVSLSGALVQAGGNAGISAGRDINVGTTEFTSSREVHTTDRLNGSHDEVSQRLGSAIVAGGNVTTLSGRDTTLTGATIAAGGNAAMIAGGDLTITAAKNTATHNEQSLGGKQAQHVSSSYDEQVSGSKVNAGGGVTLAAGQNGTGDLAILGSNVAADKGGIALVATGDVTVGSVSETHDAQSWNHTNHSGFLSKDTTTDTSASHAVYANGSTVSGDTVTGAAGRDMTISGSTIAATDDVSLSAGHDLTIGTSQDSSQSSSFHQEAKTGMGASGASISYGSRDQKDTYNDASVTHNASLVGSTDGSVKLVAGGDLHVTGSDLIAAKDVIGTGANVTLDAATNTAHHDETHEVKQSGVSLGVAGGLVDMIQSTVDQAHASDKSEDSRAATLHTIAAVGNGAAAAESMASGKPDVKIELSFGSSHSKDTSAHDSATSSGSSVKAGGTAAFSATGGDLTVAGSNVDATDVVLAAKDRVNLISTASTDSTRSTNESSGSSFGVSYGTQGYGVDASMSKSSGHANSDSTTQSNTHINASNGATIISGGDTNIVGANVNAKTVNADIGGNLNIASVQDTATSDAHQESKSGGVSISQAGGGGSFSSQHGNASGKYAGVEEQSGIRAGDGGFKINVAGNTDLKGAVIASDADASKNTLNTGTLTFSDIANHSDYSASSSGFSAGGSMGAAAKGTGPSSVSGAGGLTPMMSQNDSGSSDATTRSAISAGTIIITDKDRQTQDVSSLSRDTSHTNGAVSRLPDVQNLLDKQGNMMNAASAAGQAVATQIGAIADAKRDAAQKAQEQAIKDGNLDLAAQYGAEAAKWAEGGEYRIAMHIAGGAAVSGLGGGSVAGGAAGAGISATAAGYLNDVSNAVKGASPTGNADADRALGNILANVLATGAGAVVGGSTGAATASNTDMYNRSHDCTNSKCEGSDGSLVDRAINWAKETYSDPVGDAKRWAAQISGQAAASSGQMPPADANPLIDVTNNSKPPAAGGSAVLVPVCVPPVCTAVPAATPGTPGYVPSNATLNSGDKDSSFGGKSIDDLSDSAKVPDPSDKSGELSAAGRGLQKHGSREDSAFPAAKGNPTAINEQGQKIVDDILNDPGRTVEQLNRGRYGDVVEVRASDGRGIRYGADGRFIGFLEPNK
ncbi:hemagglutinin repeat-containing protein (plasmid) [Caballeronia sp. NK8]|uniref:hemagglutinin repeat-containing protein n=1 Tax=Caballeronia sp. NK8 TaxID=140098 RepID=UPI001BB6BB42|nr:hemagglutinin repeat-containing protein [Caballeronia sp. NK8]BCQ28286.1 hemagglutinin repeat-containing protein [Caballeronia sp. NK8]